MLKRVIVVAALVVATYASPVPAQGSRVTVIFKAIVDRALSTR